MKINKEEIGHLYDIVISIVSLNFIIKDNKYNKISRIDTTELPNKFQEIGLGMCNKMNDVLLESNTNSVYCHEDDSGLRYMSFGIYDLEVLVGTITMGPYLNYKDVNNIIDADISKNIYDCIPIINYNKEKSLADIVIAVINSSINKSEFINMKSEEIKKTNKVYTLDNYKNDILEIKKRYAFEREVLHHISNGDEKKALDTMNKFNINSLERFPDMPIRNAKNLIISINTLARKAIEKNNIDEYYLHRVSEKFALKIEYANSLKQLNQLTIEMIKEYCNLVNKCSNNNYSILVSKAINYIKLNFNQEIGLSKISKDLFVHKTNLAKKFKEEVGKTTAEYINEIRIKESKYILQNTTLSIEDIAYCVGYNDKKYFSKVFKSIEKISPSEYRKYKDV